MRLASIAGGRERLAFAVLPGPPRIALLGSAPPAGLGWLLSSRGRVAQSCWALLRLSEAAQDRGPFGGDALRSLFGRLLRAQSGA